MGDGRVVALPEPRPEDDEDVVWGLSTANALWARGERRDALVWLRRAADAANAAGQSFRASELGLYATELEETAAEMARQRSDQAPTAPSKNYGGQLPGAAFPGGDDAVRPLLAGKKANPVFASTLQSAGDSLFDGIREAKAVLRSDPPRAPMVSIEVETESEEPEEPEGHQVPWRPQRAPEVVEQHQAHEPLELADTAASPTDVARALMPSLTDDDPTLVRRLPTVEELAEQMPAPPPTRASATKPSSTAPPRPASEPPTARVESQPPPASGARQDRGPLADPPSTGGGSEGPPSSATLPAASVPKRRRRLTPILDPWSEPDEASRGPAFLARRAQSSPERLPESSGVEIREDSVVVSVRSRPVASSPPSEDDDVFTSAASLDSLRRRSGRVPPPPPPSRAVRFPADSEPQINSVSAPPPPPAPTQPEGAVERPPPPPASVVTSAALPHVPPAAPTQPGGSHAPPAPPPARPAPTPPPPARPASAPPPPPPPPRPSASVPPQHTLPPPTPQSPVPGGEAARSTRLALDPTAVPSKSGDLAPAASGAWVERTWSVEERSVGGLPLDRADALSDLPHAAQAALASRARIDSLGPDEEVSGFGAALVVGGDAAVCATIVDAPAERLHAGAVVPSRGNLGDAGVALRVVAGQSGARVAVWDWPVLDAAIAPYPLVSGELRDRADRLQALAGTTMGPLGDLDETYRNLAVERLVVRLVRPGEVFVEQGMTLGGLAIVGAGELQLLEGQAVVGEAGPGDLLFPGAVLQGLSAPATARAGANGALLLVGERALAQELLVTVPPLVEILSAGQ